MKRTASAVWHGDLKQGHGALATHSGVLMNTPYSFSTRFENGTGTNPEELIAAAHAGCFTMALSATLGGKGYTAKRLATQAAVTLAQVAGNWTVTTIHLETEAWVPGIGNEQFQAIAADAKANCPISRLLNTTITLTAKLEPQPDNS
jgi:osmotically inducible protein OsmC